MGWMDDSMRRLRLRLGALGRARQPLLARATLLGPTPGQSACSMHDMCSIPRRLAESLGLMIQSHPLPASTPPRETYHSSSENPAHSSRFFAVESPLSGRQLSILFSKVMIR